MTPSGVPSSRFINSLLLALLLAGPLFSMIRTLSIPDLVRQAEFIILAKVVQIKEISVDKAQVSTMKNVLQAEKVMKGNWSPKEPIVLLTTQCGTAGQIGWIEDSVEFPPKDSRVIVFLQKAKDGSLETVNLVQGIWPLEGNKPLGMGLGTTISQLEEVIKSQKN